MPDPGRVVVVAFEGCQVLDVTGPLEVFASAGYPVVVASPAGGEVETSCSLRLVADAPLASVSGGVDTLVVAGGDGTVDALRDRELIGWIARSAPQARRVASVCSGAFLLAEAGILSGRRATTHWVATRLLAERHPDVSVEEDPIFVRDGNVWTSAGVTAGMDLALALVEEDLGRDVALSIARRLVLFLRRPGGQSQFSASLSAQVAERDPLRDLQRWIIEHPAEDLSVARLADRVGMSVRHFARVFSEDVGATPARYVESVRIEAARRRLEESTQSIEAIAVQCGFGSPETMRRAFARTLGTGPLEYRRRFHSAVSA